MPQLSWQAAADGRYWLDAVIGNQALRLMIDLGMVDPLGEVGIEIDPGTYHQIKQAGGFSNPRWRKWRDASGRQAWTESRLTSGQLLDPLTRQPVGPAVRVYATCGAAGVPCRVGVVFFHQLAGCQVIWELDRRTWAVECP